MENDLKINVSALDPPHRRALEDVIGRELTAKQTLLISVVDAEAPTNETVRPAQSLEDCTGIYEGLSDEEVEAIDHVAKTRANLTRDLQ
jgi:hypothetical protein